MLWRTGDPSEHGEVPERRRSALVSLFLVVLVLLLSPIIYDLGEWLLTP